MNKVKDIKRYFFLPLLSLIFVIQIILANAQAQLENCPPEPIKRNNHYEILILCLQDQNVHNIRLSILNLDRTSSDPRIPKLIHSLWEKKIPPGINTTRNMIESPVVRLTLAEVGLDHDLLPRDEKEKFILSMLESDDYQVRLYAIDALDSVPTKETVDILHNFVIDGEIDEAVTAASSLAVIGTIDSPWEDYATETLRSLSKSRSFSSTVLQKIKKSLSIAESM